MTPLARQTTAGRMEKRLREDITSGVLPAHCALASTPVLAKQYGVSLVTAQKVLKKLAEEGLLIRRNGAPTIVAAQHNKIVGVLLPNMQLELNLTQSSQHYLTVCGIMDECRQQNYHMTIINTKDKKLNPADLQSLGLSGLIALYPSGHEEMLNCIKQSKLPLLCVNLLNPASNKHFNCLNFDYVGAGEQVWEYFKKRNCKNPAFYLGHLPFRDHQHRYWLFDGYKNAAAADGVTVQVIDAVECGMKAAAIARKIDSILFGTSEELDEYCSIYGKDRALFGFFHPSTNAPVFTIDYVEMGKAALKILAENQLSPESNIKLIPLKYTDTINKI